MTMPFGYVSPEQVMKDRADYARKGIARGRSVVVESLYDAADDDSATGGPDVGRRIWPTVAVVGVEGVRFVSDDELREVVEAVIAARQGNPGGAR
ncbi:MAG TPA: hypothetical protein VF228_02470 [Iamia sp.]